MSFIKPARSALLLSATLALALAGSVAIADPMSSDHMAGGGAMAGGAMAGGSTGAMSSDAMGAHTMATDSMGAHANMAVKTPKVSKRHHRHAPAMGRMAH